MTTIAADTEPHMADDYPYAAGNPLEARNTYFFTPYGGRSFLDAWKRHRDAVRASLPPAAPPPSTPGKPEPRGDVFDTGALLDYLHGAVRANRAGATNVRLVLERILGKFEVFKRIHCAYTDTYRAIDPEDFRDLTLYVRLAEVLEAAYEATGKTQFLNALLKCVDTLSALSASLPPDGQARLAWLIGRERAHVVTLAERSGVTL